jgi:hypothetical protein
MRILEFLICFAIFLFGVWLLGIADTVVGWQPAVFFGGILCIAASFAIPAHILPRTDRS